jgi:S1-C subfamily serine protease
MSFIDEGIPGVQLFTGAHDDYHRPSDTADKIDGSGLVKVATLAKEAVVYLGSREEPLTVTIPGTEGENPANPRPAAGPSGGGPGSGRKVRIGTIPDFAFQGPGVRVESVGESSPAAKAGIQPGDVIIRIDSAEIADLRGYSDVIRTLEAGQEISVVVVRDGAEQVLEVVVEAR